MLAVLLYGSETWTLTEIDWRRLDSFHTRCQGRILHIRWHGHISNDEVLRRTGLLAALSVVRRWRLGLFGHVARLADDAPASLILRTYCDGVRSSPDWRHARGRPPTTRIQQICRDTGIPVADTLELAEDKSFWRQIATAGCCGWTLRVTMMMMIMSCLEVWGLPPLDYAVVV